MTENTTKLDHRVAIFLKDGRYGVVGIWTNGFRHFVGSFDPRTSPSIYEREFVSKEIAEKSFEDHIRLTVERGWRRVWIGPAYMRNQARLHAAALN